MKKNLLTITVVIIISISYYLFIRPLSPKEALPQDLAEHAQVSYIDYGFLPDFIYCLKVKADIKQFIAFANKLELVKNTELSKYPQTCNTKVQKAFWWNPPNIKSVELIFENPKTTREMGELAVFKDGVVYFIAWNS